MAMNPLVTQNTGKTVIINGKDLREFGVELTGHPASLLPGIRRRQQEIASRAGARDFGSIYGIRELTLDFQVRGLTHQDMIQKRDALLNWIQLPQNVSEFIIGQKSVRGLKLELAGYRYEYSTGTVSVVNASDAVTGAGTNWLNRVQPRAEFAVSGDATRYTIAEVVSDTSIRLSSGVARATGSGLSYAITRSRYLIVNYAGTSSASPLSGRASFFDRVFNFSINFEAVYPFWVSDEVEWEFENVAADTFLEIDSYGNAPINPTYYIIGPAANPKITTGKYGLVARFSKTNPGNPTGARDLLNDTDITGTLAAGPRVFDGFITGRNQAAISSRPDNQAGERLMLTSNAEGYSNTTAKADRFNAGNFSVSFWFTLYRNLKLNEEHYLFRASADQWVRVGKDTTGTYISFKFVDASGGSATAYATLNAGTRYHLVFGYDATTPTGFAYLDNVSLGISITASTPITNPDSYLYFGGDVSTSLGLSFPGVVGEVGIWEDQLTTTHISSLFNAGNGAAVNTVNRDKLLLELSFQGSTGDIIASGDTGNLLQVPMDKNRPTGNAYGIDGVSAEVATFTEGLGYRQLAPANIADKLGVLISQADNLQYSRGSHVSADGSGVVYENVPVAQGTLEFWVRPNWDGDDGEVHYIYVVRDNTNSKDFKLFKDSNNNLRFKIEGTTSPNITLSGLNSSNFGAGTWHHIVAVWSENEDVNGSNNAHLYLDYNVKDGGDTTIPAFPGDVASISIGQSYDQANQFNGTIAGRILNRPLTSTEVTNLYNSGNGSTDSFTVTPDTVWMGVYSDDSTAAIFQHRGQQISSIVTTTITTSEPVGQRSWKNGDRVVVYDDAATPNVVRTTISGTPSGSTITVADDCSAVTGTNKWISKNLLADGQMEHADADFWTAGDAATTLAKDTTTVKFDTRSLKITNGDATQAFARQTITTAAGEDYHFHGWFYAPTTPNGASQLVDVDGDPSLGITVTQANLSAGWNEIDFTFEAADASTTIDLGSGSVTSGESGYWDNVSIMTNLVNNPGMEGTYVSGVAPGWLVIGSPTVAESADAHSGSKAQSVDGSSGNILRQIRTTVAGKYYTLSLSVKNGPGGNIYYQLVNSSSIYFSDSSASYIRKSFTFKAEGPSVEIRLWDGIFDDVSLIELDQVDASTATASIADNSYNTGRWLDADGSVMVDGTDELYYGLANNLNAAEGSIGFWANIKRPYDGAEDSVLFDVTGSGDNVMRLLYRALDDKFVYYIEAGDRVVSVAQTDNTNFYSWRHFCITWSYSTNIYRLYMDGQLVGSYTSALTSPTYTSNLYFGRLASGGDAGDVLFDDIVTKNYALTSDEVGRLYEEKLRLTNGNLAKGYYYTVGGRPGLYGGLSGQVDYTAKGNPDECSFVIHFIADFDADSALAPYTIVSWHDATSANYYRLYYDDILKEFIYLRYANGTPKWIISQAQNFKAGQAIDIEVSDGDGISEMLINGVDQNPTIAGAFASLASPPTTLSVFPDPGAPITMLQLQAFIKALPVEELRKESVDWAAGDLAENSNATLSIADTLDEGDYYELDCDAEVYEKYDASTSAKSNIYQLVSGKTPSLLAEPDNRTIVYLQESMEGFKLRFRPHWL